MKAKTVQALSKDQKKVLEKYVSLLDGVPGPVSVWTTTDEGRLHFYTVIPPGRDNFSAVFRAELALMQDVDPLTLDFDVYDRADAVTQFFPGASPAFHRN